jgi:transposase InsO family protein
MKQVALSLIKEAVSQGASRFKACEILGISCRTLRRWQDAKSLNDQRKGAKRSPSPQTLTPQEKARMVAVSNSPEYQSLPPSQIVPKLADKGIYIASESSFYRVLREHEQVNRRGNAKAPRVVEKPLALTATRPGQIWSWDITYLPTDVRGQFFRLYMVLDVYSRLIVGWEVHLNETAELAGELMEKACLRHKIRRDQLVLHSDNGSPMKGATMLATLQKLGVMPSFSRPSVSDDNPYSESLFRTLKYTPAYPKGRFKSIEQAREWVLRFVTWYNNEHHHSGIKFVTPAQRHEGKDKQVLIARTAVYETAKKAHPNRWRGRAVRNWEYDNEVSLNPNKAQKELPEMETVAA